MKEGGFEPRVFRMVLSTQEGAMVLRVQGPVLSNLAESFFTGKEKNCGAIF